MAFVSLLFGLLMRRNHRWLTFLTSGNSISQPPNGLRLSLSPRSTSLPVFGSDVFTEWGQSVLMQVQYTTSANEDTRRLDPCLPLRLPRYAMSIGEIPMRMYRQRGRAQVPKNHRNLCVFEARGRSTAPAKRNCSHFVLEQFRSRSGGLLSREACPCLFKAGMNKFPVSFEEIRCSQYYSISPRVGTGRYGAKDLVAP
jgi:hypothetical protein